LEASL